MKKFILLSVALLSFVSSFSLNKKEKSGVSEKLSTTTTSKKEARRIKKKLIKMEKYSLGSYTSKRGF